MSMRDALRQAGIPVPDQPERRDEMLGPRDRPGGQRSGGSGGRHDDARGPGGGGPRRNQPSPQFPEEYFGLDQTGNRYLLTDFVSREKVDPLLVSFRGPQGQQGQPRKPALTTGQLRRFYNYCRNIERRLNVEECSWEQVAADFEALAFHAQYAQSDNKIPPEFQQFIDDNVRRVNAAKDHRREAFLRGFLPHFEALVGFGAAHLRQN